VVDHWAIVEEVLNLQI